MQTVRHRDFFLPVDTVTATSTPAAGKRETALSLGLLLVCLVAVVGFAKAAGAGNSVWRRCHRGLAAVVGVAIAMLVLLPETFAAARARANRMQTSLNLALGSALASIGLTIPW